MGGLIKTVSYNSSKELSSYLRTMKVTAILDKQLIEEAVSLSGSNTVTDALNLSLTEYVGRRKLTKLNTQIANEIFEFNKSAEALRNLNRS